MYFDDVDVWEMVMHVVSESCFAIVLLFAHHFSVFGLFHEHDLGFATGDHHEHFGGKIATGEGILSVEGERVEVGHEGVEHNKGDGRLVELIGEFSCGFKCRWDEHHTVGLCSEAGLRLLIEGGGF